MSYVGTREHSKYISGTFCADLERSRVGVGTGEVNSAIWTFTQPKHYLKLPDIILKPAQPIVSGHSFSPQSE